MPTFASTLCRRLVRLAWAFLYLLASRPAPPGSEPDFWKFPKKGL